MSLLKNLNSNHGTFLWISIISWISSFSIIYGVFWSFPFNIPNILAFSFILSMFPPLVIFVVTSEATYRNSHNSETKFHLIYLLGYIITLFIGFVTYYSNGPILGIMSNPIGFIASFIVTALLNFLLPGFSIVNLTGLKKCFNKEEKIVVAVIASTAISGIIGVLAWGVGDVFTYGVPALLIANSIIIGVELIRIIKERMAFTTYEINNSMSEIKKSKMVEIVILCCASVFVLISYFTIHYAFTETLPILGDEFVHVGFIEKILNGYFSWQETQLGILSSPAYPFIWHSSMALSVSASNLPLVSFYLLSSVVFLPLPILGIKSLSYRLTKNSSISMLSVLIFSVFAGLGWIATFLLPASTSELSKIYISSVATQDIIYSTWFPVIVGPYVLDLTVFLVSLSLMTRFDLDSKTLTGILTVLLSFAILTHLEKVVLLAGLGLILALLQNLIKKKRLRTSELGIALFSSAVLVIFLDLFLSKSLYTTTFRTPLVFAAIIGIVIWSLSTNTAENILNKLRINSEISSKLLAISVPIGLLLIALLDIIAFSTPSAFTVVTPLFLLPTKLGFAGAFALIYYIPQARNADRRKSAISQLTIGIFLTGVLLYHTPFPLYSVIGFTLDEFRFIRDIAWPIISILAACGLYEFLKKIGTSNHDEANERIVKRKIPVRRLIAVSFIMALLIAPSTLSHMLKVEYMSAYSRLSDDQQELAIFLSSLEVDDGASIYSPVALRHIVTAATGVSVYTPDTPYFGEILDESNEVSSILYTLWYLNISYVVTSTISRDIFLTQLMQSHLEVYRSSSYSVYNVISITPPSVDTRNSVPYKLHIPSVLGENAYRSHDIWKDEFDSIDSWQISSNTNVGSHEITWTSGGTLRVGAQVERGSRGSVIVTHNLNDTLIFDNDIRLSIRYRTTNQTRLVASLLLSNGTYISVESEGSIYLNSDDWTWASTTAYSGLVEVIAINVGITNFPETDNSELLAEVDAIYLTDGDSRDAELANLMSIAGVNYTVSYFQNDEENIIYEGIFAAEGSNNDTLAKFLELADSGQKVIIFGNLYNSKWASQLITIESSNESSTIDYIGNGTSLHTLPSFNLNPLTVTGANVIARFGNTTMPLIMEIPVSNETHITYINLWPIVNTLKLEQEASYRIQFYDAIKFLLLNLLSLEQSNSELREFYLKCDGSINLNGSILISFRRVAIYESGYPSFIGVNKISVNGHVIIRPYSWGCVNVTILGGFTIFYKNGTSVTNWSDTTNLLLEMTEISGQGSVEFESLSSGLPYALNLYRSEYQFINTFSVIAVPISSEFIFLVPYDFPGI